MTILSSKLSINYWLTNGLTSRNYLFSARQIAEMKMVATMLNNVNSKSCRETYHYESNGNGEQWLQNEHLSDAVPY